MQLYVGYSLDKSADQILEWLDIDPNHPEGISVFERTFDCGYIGPGDFEVYGIEDMGGEFTASKIKAYFPFSTANLNLLTSNLEAATCIFWIRNESEWQEKEAEGITICDKIYVDKLKYENNAN